MNEQERKRMPLTEKQIEVLQNLPDDEFVTPYYFGGYDASHHSGTARALAKRGLVEVRRCETLSGLRCVNKYRRTAAGSAALKALEP